MLEKIKMQIHLLLKLDHKMICIILTSALLMKNGVGWSL